MTDYFSYYEGYKGFPCLRASGTSSYCLLLFIMDFSNWSLVWFCWIQLLEPELSIIITYK